jgi:hypothetical protein
MSRRWRHLRLRRGKYIGPPPSSPVPAVPPPPAIRQAGPWPRFGARLLPSRRRRADPGWGQGTLGVAWPSFIRQAGSRNRPMRPVASRGRRFDPPWFPPPPVPPPQLLRPAGSLRFGARLLPSRRRHWSPGFGQANQGAAWPAFPRQAGTRARYPHVISAHGRLFEPPWPQAVITDHRICATVTSALTATATLTSALTATATVTSACC